MNQCLPTYKMELSKREFSKKKKKSYYTPVYTKSHDVFMYLFLFYFIFIQLNKENITLITFTLLLLWWRWLLLHASNIQKSCFNTAHNLILHCVSHIRAHILCKGMAHSFTGDWILMLIETKLFILAIYCNLV